MLRAVIRYKVKDQYNGAEYQRLQTLEIDCPELETVLRDGGMSESGYSITELVGVEVVNDQQ